MAEPSETTPTQADPVKVRRAPMFLCALVGVAAVFVAWRLVHSEDDRQFWSDVLVSIGTAFLIAGAIFLAERSFIRRTNQAVRETATSVARGAVAETQGDVRRMNERLDDIARQVQDRVRMEATQNDAAVERLAEDVSFESFADALRPACALGAIDDSVTVPGSQDGSGPSVTVSYGPALSENGTAESIWFTVGESRAGVPWDKGVSYADFVTEVKRRLVQDGSGKEARDLDPEAVAQNLRVVLTDACKARRHDRDAWLSGATVRELMADGWVHTDDGIEERDHGLVINYEDVPAAASYRGDEDWNPEQPDWAGTGDWSRAVEVTEARRTSEFVNRLRS